MKRLYTGRRNLLGLGTTIAATAAISPFINGCFEVDDTEGEAVINNLWQSRVAGLRNTGVYSASKPGEAPRHGGAKVGTHVPTLSVTASEIRVTSSHVMSPDEDHFITALWVENQNGIILHFQEFRVTDAKAEFVTGFPEGTEEVIAFAHCNQHDVWKSDPAAPGVPTVNRELQRIAAELERYGVWTTGNEGPWTGKAAGHVPKLERQNDKVVLTMTHGMAQEHWITSLYIRVDDVVTALTPLAKDATPTATFTLPLGARKVVGYSHCNVHDVWASAPLTVS